MSIIQYEIQDRVAYLTLNRPEKRNALSPSLIAELHQTLQAAIQNPQVKVIVLRANGEVFSAGADLEYLQTLQNNSYEENLADSKHLSALFQTIYHAPKIVIAQVEGHAIAGGCGLATICDIVFASPNAKFGYTEVGIGFIPALVSVFLLRKIGETHAKDLLLSGRLVAADEALRIGMINFVVPQGDMRVAVQKYAQRICQLCSAESIGLTKSLMTQVQDLPFAEAIELAAQKNAYTRQTDDCKRGIAAFLAKEKIEW